MKNVYEGRIKEIIKGINEEGEKNADDDDDVNNDFISFS